MARATLAVHGLADLNRAWKVAPKSLQREWRQGQRSLAEPVRELAASRALAEISGMSRSPAWAGMRTGVTQRVVYIAPKRRSRGGSKRRNLAPLLLDRAMIPALEHNARRVEQDAERMLATMGRAWERV